MNFRIVETPKKDLENEGKTLTLAELGKFIGLTDEDLQNVSRRSIGADAVCCKRHDGGMYWFEIVPTTKEEN